MAPCLPHNNARDWCAVLIYRLRVRGTHDKVRSGRNTPLVQRAHAQRRHRGCPQPQPQRARDPDGPLRNLPPRPGRRGGRHDHPRHHRGLRGRGRPRRGSHRRPQRADRGGRRPAVHALARGEDLRQPQGAGPHGQEDGREPLDPHPLLHGPGRRRGRRPDLRLHGEHQARRHHPQRARRRHRGHQPRHLRGGARQADCRREHLQRGRQHRRLVGRRRPEAQARHRDHRPSGRLRLDRADPRPLPGHRRSARPRHQLPPPPLPHRRVPDGGGGLPEPHGAGRALLQGPHAHRVRRGRVPGPRREAHHAHQEGRPEVRAPGRGPQRGQAGVHHHIDVPAPRARRDVHEDHPGEDPRQEGGQGAEGAPQGRIRCRRSER